jgi:hypothetical protein
MKFGPAEMAQMMDSGKALIIVTFVAAACIGIALGAIVALYHRHRADHFGHRAADRSFQSAMPTVPALPAPVLPTARAMTALDETALRSAARKQAAQAG